VKDSDDMKFGKHETTYRMVGGAAIAAPDWTAPTAAPRAVEASLTERLPGQIYWCYRRTLDVVAAVAGLALLLVLLPALAILIKLDSPGPVFYGQERIGINRRRRQDGARSADDRRKIVHPGRPFRIYKLRTMCQDAEANGARWAAKNDARVTRVGRFLRQTRLDELPQFWNVLRGDMSLIGPRPERLVFIRQLEHVVPFYHERLLVKPGLTGLAQVRNGYDTDEDSVVRKVAYDRDSIRRAGLRMDLRILLSTIRVVLKGEGAR